QAMAAFDAEQYRQDSLKKVARQQQAAAWAAQKAQRAARYEAGRREAPRERASRAPARAHHPDETAARSTRAGAELPLAAAPSSAHHATTAARPTDAAAHSPQHPSAHSSAHHATTAAHHVTTAARSTDAAAVPAAAQRLDLNQVDSLTLLSVKGIGPYSAGKILAYRRALGGFVSLDQLDEIEGLRAENLQNLKQVAYLHSAETPAAGDSLAGVKQLLVNKADFKQLLRHPYLSYSQVCAIVNRRRESGRIDSLEALVFMEEFGPKDLHRLRPYLDFQ
ncbi:MAG: helix-hairpin-helix domain-containing protein, partial [Bacteroidales bacterium]|nr:helix-hairpin-helix domain-containing protein [Bacteroidales bacterium]